MHLLLSLLHVSQLVVFMRLLDAGRFGVKQSLPQKQMRANSIQPVDGLQCLSASLCLCLQRSCAMKLVYSTWCSACSGLWIASRVLFRNADSILSVSACGIGLEAARHGWNRGQGAGVTPPLLVTHLASSKKAKQAGGGLLSPWATGATGVKQGPAFAWLAFRSSDSASCFVSLTCWYRLVLKVESHEVRKSAHFCITWLSACLCFCTTVVAKIQMTPRASLSSTFFYEQQGSPWNVRETETERWRWNKIDRNRFLKFH